MQRDVSILDLPAGIPTGMAVCDVAVCDAVVVPPIPPRPLDDEPLELQECPTCHGLITFEDEGINYCYRCGHLIFVGDGRSILHFEPHSRQCPCCRATLEEDYFVARPGRGDFFCRQCGNIMDWYNADQDGFQFVKWEKLADLQE